MNDIRFDDRVVIVTGASSGIGRAHALYLARRGAKVLVNSRTKPAAQAVTAEIETSGGEALAYAGDVGLREDAEAMAAAALTRWGRIDVLINNAGFVRDRSFMKMTAEDFDAVVQAHLGGSIHCTRAVLPAMKQQGYGRIVFTTSGAGFYGNFGQSNYSSAKLGMIGFMRTLRLEIAQYGIHVNALAPIALTPMNAALMPPELRERLDTQSTAAAATFLASEQCRLNGETLVAGGGQFACMQFTESRGVQAAEHEISPEFIASRWDAIADSHDAYQFADGSAAFAARFGHSWGK